MKIDNQLFALWSLWKDQIGAQDKIKMTVLFQHIKKCREEHKFAKLEEKFRLNLQKCIDKVEWKKSNIPVIAFDETLPIYNEKDKIKNAILENQVVIVCGDTGSGKTTQLPLICLELGYGIKGLIGCTQPRRIAATSVAARVAEELNSKIGEVVGHEVRFNKNYSDHTMIKFMTDGILLAETQFDAKLLQYDVLIIDEAHERSLNIDFALGYLKEILPSRNDLKVIISSATLEAQKFSEFFEDAPVFTVEGRTFPIEDIYLEEFDEEEDLDILVDRGIQWISSLDSKGDILVFLPGEKEIYECERKIKGQHYSNTDVLPLYARLGSVDQQKIFKPQKNRKIILATNIAETSLTIPGIRYVVETGLARISRYSNNSQVQKLQTEWVSKANVKQRRGRCGRVEEGICYHLYTKLIYDEMSEFAEPEIRRTSLAGVILQMKKLKLKDLGEFPLIDQPNKKMIQAAYQNLHALGALNAEREITAMGEKILQYPLDPHLARMIIEASQKDCLHEILILVAVLSAQDPRERPANASIELLNMQKKWDHDKSDFMTFLNLWKTLTEEKDSRSNSQFKKFLKDHLISYRKFDEWKSIYRELKTTAQEQKLKINNIAMVYDNIHQSLLSGLTGLLGYLDEKQVYRGAGGLEFYIFPGSVLFKKQPKWVICFAMVETSKLFARTVAEVNPLWIEKIAPHLCKYHYTDAIWNSKQGCPYAYEHVSIPNYPAFIKRSVYYGKIDPIESRRIFILEGLLKGEMHTKFSFFKKNLALIDQVKYLEIKCRKINGLYDENGLLDFYNNRLPSTVHTTKLFEQWFADASKESPELLQINESDIFIPQLDEISSEQYPDFFELNGNTFDIKYQYAPTYVTDGATLYCPLHLLGQLKQTHCDWLIMGYLKEKVLSLFKTLPKTMRVKLQPAAEWVNGFMAYSYQKENSLIHELCRYSLEKYNVEITGDSFNPSEIPGFLKVRILVIGAKKEEIDFDRDLVTLQNRLKIKADEEFERVTEIEIPITSWADWKAHQFPIETKVLSKAGEIIGYPALVKNIKNLTIKVFQTIEDADAEHINGLVKMFEMENKDLVTYLYQKFPINHNAKNYFTVITKNSSVFIDVIANRAIRKALGVEKNATRDPVEFQRIMAEARGSIVSCAEEMARSLEDAVGACNEMNQFLLKCKGQAYDKSVKDIHESFSLLMLPEFFCEYSAEFILNLGKILKGFSLRAERLTHSPMKDNQKSTQVFPYVLPYIENKKRLEDWVGSRKSLVVYLEDLFLFKTSVYAQEIKLPKKISAKIMDASLEKFQVFLKKI